MSEESEVLYTGSRKVFDQNRFKLFIDRLVSVNHRDLADKLVPRASMAGPLEESEAFNKLLVAPATGAELRRDLGNELLEDSILILCGYPELSNDRQLSILHNLAHTHEVYTETESRMTHNHEAYKDMESRTKKTEKQNRDLRSDVAKLKQSYNEMESRTKKTEEQNKYLRSEVAKLNQVYIILAQTHESQTKIETRMAHNHKAYKEMESRTKKTEEQNIDLQSKVAKPKQLYDEMESRAKETNEQNTDLQSEEVAALKESYQAIRARLLAETLEKIKHICA